MSHSWPTDGGCYFGEWQIATGLPNAKLYRKCVFPKCGNVEYKDVPKG